jgi:hypothetical protein
MIKRFKKIIYIFYPQILFTVLFIVSVSISIKNNVFFTNPNQSGVYSAKSSSTGKLDSYFENKSNLLELNFFNKKNIRARESLYTVVADINNDQYDDLITISQNNNYKKSTQINILINQNGIKFLNKTNDYIRIGKGQIPVAAAVFDIDNDDWKDLVVTFTNGDVYFYKNEKNRFKIFENIPKYNSVGDKRSIALADFNNDGFVDMYLGSYFNVNLYSNNLTGYNSKFGGKNELLLNQRGVGFKNVTEDFGVNDSSYTWTSALADFNQDGYVDIINANDFGRNVYLQNFKGEFFLDKSNYFNVDTDSFNMSSEVLDINNNGIPEVYISNANKFPMLYGNNKLLELEKDKFKDFAKDLNMNACGWSWGAKSFDPELKNKPAIFVVNSPNWSSGQNFRSSYFSIPVFIKSFISKFNFSNGASNLFLYDVESTKQKYCVFYEKDGSYVDIAKDLGVERLEGGRTISEIDYNLDGISDFLINSSEYNATLLKGVYTGSNDWIGVDLKGRKNNKDAIGAKVIAKIGNQYFHKFNFPTNGFSSQSSKKIKFGIPQGVKKIELKIIWPMGGSQIEYIELNDFNKYVTIFENSIGSF